MQLPCVWSSMCELVRVHCVFISTRWLMSPARHVVRVSPFLFLLFSRSVASFLSLSQERHLSPQLFTAGGGVLNKSS